MDGCDAKPGGSTQCVYDGPGWGGADELLAELSRLIEGGRCDWLAEAICPGTINREQRAAACKAPSDEPVCVFVPAATPVPKLQQQRSGRRYPTRTRCLLCMWFGCGETIPGDDNCVHVKRAIEIIDAPQTTRVQQDRLLQTISDGFTRQDDPAHLWPGASKFASYHKWLQLRRRRRRQRSTKKAQTGYKVPQAPLQLGSEA